MKEKIVERIISVVVVGTLLVVYIWVAFLPLAALYKEVRGIRAELKQLTTDIENNLF